MSKRDKRVKGCPNADCLESKQKKKYKAEDQFCKKCGTQLIFVCARCHNEIENIEGHVRCRKCEAIILNDGGKAKHVVKDFSRRAKANAVRGTKAANDKVRIHALKVKEKTPKTIKKVKQLAENEKARRVVTVLADAAADNVKNPKVKKLAKKIIRIVR